MSTHRQTNISGPERDARDDASKASFKLDPD